MDLVINKLPAPTWNRLGVNKTILRDINIKNGSLPVVRTEGKGHELLELTYTNGSYENELCLDLPPHSQRTVLVLYTSSAAAEGLSSIKTTISLGEGARLRLVELQLLGKGFTQIKRLKANLDKEARLELLQLELGAGKSYAEAIAELAGAKAEFKAELGFYGRENQLIDINYVANHLGKKTQSSIQAQGVLRDRAQKIFRGTIDFKQGASGAVGSENESVLLLTDEVVNKSVPLILCAEEDVVGNHGASIGRLDEELLFYLMSRGFSEDEATRMMAKAKLEALYSGLEDDKALAAVEAYMEDIGK